MIVTMDTIIPPKKITEKQRRELADFLNARPSLNKAWFEREADLPLYKLKELTSGKQTLSLPQYTRLLLLLRDYGWQEDY